MRGRLAPWVVGASAFLLFLVQPLLGRRLLPVLGGTPSVWAATMVVFQVLYLLGYAVAHRAAAAPRGGRVAHALLVLAGAAALPLWYLPASAPQGGLPPAAWLVRAVVLSVGVPFLALAVTTPLVHRWTARAREAAGRDPWRLYAAGSGGSLLALLAYPVVLEPALGVSGLMRAWGIAYGLVALGVLGLVVVRRSAPGDRPRAVPTPRPARRTAPGTFLHWTALAATASGLFLAITQHVTTDLAPVPLLWVLPLALFLGATVVVFLPHGERAVALARLLLVPGAVLVAWLLLAERPEHHLLQVLAYLLFVAVASLALWGRLAERRPLEAGAAASWYLATALGGALGGLAVGLLAPLVLDGPYELPALVLAAAVLGAAPAVRRPRAAPVQALAGGAAALGLFLVLKPAGGAQEGFALAAGCAAGAVLVAALWGRPAAWGALAVVLVLPAVALRTDFAVLHAERTFFGLHTVLDVPEGADAPAHRRLVHGRTIHGVQFTAPARRREATLYYARATPAGDVMTNVPHGTAPPRVALVGLGIGTLACYAESGWQVHAIEVDEAVVRIARDPALFTFLADSPATIRTTVGDGRLVLAAAPAAAYDLVVVDAFSSDAVPVHLLTREALAIDLAAVAEGGWVVFHLSSHRVDLVPVVAAAAAAAGGRTLSLTRAGATWAAVARADADLEPLRARGWMPVAPADLRAPWTDDRVRLLEALR